MSAAQIANDKATSTRRYDALNSGAVRLVSKMIDELFDSDVRLGAPLPVDATGRLLLVGHYLAGANRGRGGPSDSVLRHIPGRLVPAIRGIRCDSVSRPGATGHPSDTAIDTLAGASADGWPVASQPRRG